MAIDPICHMTVNEKTALKAGRDGRVYHFCSLHCKGNFEAGSKDKLPEVRKIIRVIVI